MIDKLINLLENIKEVNLEPINRYDDYIKTLSQFLDDKTEVARTLNQLYKTFGDDYYQYSTNSAEITSVIINKLGTVLQNLIKLSQTINLNSMVIEENIKELKDLSNMF